MALDPITEMTVAPDILPTKNGIDKGFPGVRALSNMSLTFDFSSPD